MFEPQFLVSVVKQLCSLNKTVHEGSQAAEFLFHKGLFDPISPRNLLKGILRELFQLHVFFPLTCSCCALLGNKQRYSLGDFDAMVLYRVFPFTYTLKCVSMDLLGAILC